MSARKPNIIVILVDDMGYSDLGCYGGEILTPNLDKLAHDGVRLSQFYTTPKCAPSRACLLTGLYPHQVGMAILPLNGMNKIPECPDGYVGDLALNCLTIPEALKTAGYRCYMSGKWHLTNNIYTEDHTWPLKRGFDHHFGTLNGATSYFWPGSLKRDSVDVEHEAENDPNFYLTDAISDHACKYIREHSQSASKESPFFMYVAYTCPHWPLHAKKEDIENVKGRYDVGWDVLREKRQEKQWQMGLLDPKWKLSPKDSNLPNWSDIPEKERPWYARRMEVYAAQIENMDRGIGRIVETLELLHLKEDTLIVFMSDNGACHEELREGGVKWRVNKGGSHYNTKSGVPIQHGNIKSIMPGSEETFQSVGKSWANLSNTPFRGHKNQTLEGGIATPFIMSYPRGIPFKGEIRHGASHLVNLMPTLLDFAGVEFPTSYKNRQILPLEGVSFRNLILNPDTWKSPSLVWEYEDNAAIREGNLKLVKVLFHDWELFQIEEDRTELHPLTEKLPDVAKGLEQRFYVWAQRIGVVPMKKIISLRGRHWWKQLRFLLKGKKAYQAQK